jgi:hypothetical protein
MASLILWLLLLQDKKNRPHTLQHLMLNVCGRCGSKMGTDQHPKHLCPIMFYQGR